MNSTAYFHKIKSLFIQSFKEKLNLTSREASIELNLIFQHVMKCKFSQIITNSFEISKKKESQIEKLIEKRLSGTPLAYLFREWSFYGRKFYVNNASLIPRADTELIVDLLKDELKSHQNLSLLDLGSGTGVIGISAKLEIEQITELTLSDISKRCVELINKNLYFHEVKANVIQSNWFKNFPLNKYDIIVSNPPYIDQNDRHLDDLKFEPKKALISKKNGLNDIEIILKEASAYLKENGAIYIEHGYNQGKDVIKLFNDNGFQKNTCFKDINGNERVSRGYKLN